jgi:AhpD family alkylhydroperoxidase
MPRIPLLADHQVGWLTRTVFRAARRRFGAVPEPFRAAANHRGLMWASTLHELAAERAARRLDPALRDIVVHRVATVVGCSWCVDFGTMQWVRQGLDADALRWAAADDAPDDARFDETERRVLAYADAMTAQPTTVDDAMVADLDDRLGHAGLVELTHLIALENMRSRTYSALGIHEQGFAAECAVPPR